MKPLPFLIASALLAALVLAPMISAAGSITFSSPASGASYSGSQSYTIAGTVSPAPGQPDSVFIAVKNPAGQTVDATSVAVNPSTGAFSYSTAVGGPSGWTTGTFTITATDSFSATGSTTFHYTAASAPTAGYVTVLGPTLLLPGQTGNVYIWASSTGSVTAWYLAPGATSPTALAPSRVLPSPGGLVIYSATFTLPGGSPDGVYLVGASVTNATSSFTASNIGSFTVNGQLATKASAQAGNAVLQKDIAANFSALNSAVGSINTAIGGITTTLGNMQTTLGTINTNVNTLSGLSGQLTSAANSIGTTQTYVLVVAVLAAITLVLELAILVRKLS